ncbi:unnamed protein product [Ectocarpus sp. 12 AP-2014]
MKFSKAKKDEPSIRDMVQDLKSQQEQLVQTFDEEQDLSCQRISNALTDLELYTSKLQTIILRLDNITETLVDESDLRIKPWYVRIFCP